MSKQKQQSILFNSLGSNYSESYVTTAQSLLLHGSKRDSVSELKKELRHYLGDGVFRFFYKGRDAITIALESIQTENKVIFVQAFSCYAIEEAIVRAGWQPIYVDVMNNSLLPSVETIESARVTYKTPQVLLLQHTLGYGADVKKIKKWCAIHDVILIDDLAQSFGAVDNDKKYIGSQADIVVGSFGRDKIIDGISGGFIFVANNSRLPPISLKDDEQIPISVWQKKKDLLYPLVTTFFRNNYPSVVSKVVLAIAKKVGIITTPLAAPKEVFEIPSEHAHLAMLQCKNLEQQLYNRKAKAHYYFANLIDLANVTLPIKKVDIDQGSNLRFPIIIKEPAEFINRCRKRDIHISDRWYRSPVDCSTLECESIYTTGTCPNAEYLSEHIINLPTHQYVTQAQQKIIIELLANT